MTEKHDPRTKLLTEIFHEEWSGGAPAGFARDAAALVRRRRRLRHSLVAAGTAAAVAVLTLVLSRPAPEHFRQRSLPQAEPAYEIISDDELLAQLSDRPLLAMRTESGTREFVLLEP